MADVILGSIPDVELVHAGTWELASGTATFTQDDLRAAVEAMECPAIRNPVLKLGHRDERFTPGDGEPSIGWVGNLHTDDGGYRLAGDFLGMPQWLVDVSASAYPDRSVEGSYDFRCQMGHVHPFVLTAVALLGVTAPGVGTLESLQDVAALYGVDAGAPPRRDVRIIVGGSMADRSVAAAVSVEDVQRAFMEVADWSTWIVEFSLTPLQVVVTNEDGEYYTRAVEIDDAAQTVTFGPAVEVERAWVPADDADETLGDTVVIARAAGRVTFASAEASRAVEPPITVEANGQTAIVIPEARPVPRSKEGAGMDSALLREALGLTAEASDADVSAAVVAAGLASPVSENPTPAPLPDGLVAIDADTLQGLQVAAAAGVDANTRLRTQDRDNAITAAIKDGKFAPARRGHYEAAWEADPEGTKSLLGSLAKGLIPVTASGYAGDADTPEGAADSEFDALFRHAQTQEA